MELGLGDAGASLGMALPIMKKKLAVEGKGLDMRFGERAMIVHRERLTF